MSDFYGFKTGPLDSSYQDEDDPDYDDKNNETFGDDNDTNTDWEENHEHFASNQVSTKQDNAASSREHLFDKENELAKRVATSILDDENDANELPSTSAESDPYWLQQPSSSQRLILYVEDLEKQMRQNVSSGSESNLPVHNTDVPYSAVESNKPLGQMLPPRPMGPPLRPQGSVPLYMAGGPGTQPKFVGPCPTTQPLLLPGQIQPPGPLNRGAKYQEYGCAKPVNQYQQAGGCMSYRHVDEYANLMTQRDKLWLYQIQMAQINSNDYYYQTYMQRQQGNASRKMNNQAADVVNNKPAAYTPLQFENSLGKLQIGSVIAPRKMIDMDLVEKPDGKVIVDNQKSKSLLAEIEWYYSMILAAESSLRASNAITPQLALMLLHIVTLLCQNKKLVDVMGIRKGKDAVLRLLPLLKDNSLIIDKLLQDLMAIVKRDSRDESQILLTFLPAIRTFLFKVPLRVLVAFMKSYNEPFYLSTKLTVSIIANMVERAEKLIPNSTEEEVEDWKRILESLAKATKYWKEGERPVVAVNSDTLTQHLSLVRDTVDSKHMETLIRVLSKQPLNDLNI